MMYSKTTRGFHEDGAAPEDAVEVSAEEYRALFAAQAQGKRIEANDAGFPIAVDPPPVMLTAEQMLMAAQGVMDEKAQELRYSDLADVLSYADDENADYAADAAKFKRWRSSVRSFALSAKAKDYAGLGDFVAALPAFPKK